MGTTKRFLLVTALALVVALPTWAGGKNQPNKVRATLGIAYYEGKDADPEKHKLDIYVPKGKQNFPVIFFIHGGGWRKGSRGKFAKFCQVLAGQGVGAVATSYRLTPQVKHPGHIEDVARAFAWTYNNIEKYGGNPDNLFVSGHSAGGHLAALLATDESYLKKHGLNLDAIQGAIPISGVYNITPGRIAAVFGKDPEECKQASPLTHVSGNHPPFLILYAEKDGKGFDKMADKFGAALKKAGGEATVREMADRNHGTIMSSIIDPSDPTAQAILEFVRKHTEK